MKVTGSVIQLVKWEDRNEYFDVPNNFITPHDLIVISSIDDSKKSFLRKWIEQFKYKKIKTLEDFTLDQCISMWVKRPHNYNEGDNIVVDININKVSGEQ